MGERRSYRYMLDKKPLAELLPLKAPLSVLIEPTNVCNLRCTFCPTGDELLMKKFKRKSGMMGIDLYRKILNGMTYFEGGINILHLFKDGEPLLNRDLPLMVRLAKDQRVAKTIAVTTNGTLLNKACVGKLFESGLDMIRISLAHVDESGYEFITGKRMFDRVLRNVEFLYDEKVRTSNEIVIFIKMIDIGLTEEAKSLFAKTFGPLCDFYSIDELVGWGHGDEKDFFMGKKVDKSIDGLFNLKDVNVCPDIFKGVAINFDGAVSACCVDWCHELIVGDTNKENFCDIWNGTKLRELRLQHLSGERKKIPICATCQYVMGMDPISELDGCSERLKDVYKIN